MFGDHSLSFIRAHADSEHGAAGSSAFIHKTSAQHDDPGGLIQRKDACDACGGDFADAVSDDSNRLNAQ